MLAIVGLSLWFCLTTAAFAAADHAMRDPAGSACAPTSEPRLNQLVARESEDQSKKYRWLFRERAQQEPQKEAEPSTLIDRLDKEIKQARKQYLSGEVEDAILKYRSAIDRLESLIEDTPAGDPLLGELEERFAAFDELATKILGPIQSEPKEDLAGTIFHLMEKRRVCRRNLAMKKARVVQIFDVSSSLLSQESDILSKLLDTRKEGSTPDAREAQTALTGMLADVRKSIFKGSSRCALLRKGAAISLADVRRDLVGPNSMILDFNLLSDRMVVGVITSEKAVYYQVAANRSEIDKEVLRLQDQLRELTLSETSSFMGHAWKEPCRRIYRSLLGKLPPLPKEKSTVYVIPDRSLWYLPFSAMLDAEDRAFGRENLVSLIPSVDMLRMIRSGFNKGQYDFSADLMLFESIPWISEDQIQQKPSTEGAKKKTRQKLSEGEKLERLVLKNPVYPKPSEIVVTIQKMFKKPDVWVGPVATLDRLTEYKGRAEEVTVLAVPLGMIDAVSAEKQPCFFFSPDKAGKRRLDVRHLFAYPIGSRVVIMPISWLDVQDRDTPLGEGPLLLTTALFYSGVRLGMVNYSDPTWGSNEPFLLNFLKKAAQKVPPSEALAGYAAEIPAGLDSSFSGKPPSWAGWILMGDPR